MEKQLITGNEMQLSQSIRTDIAKHALQGLLANPEHRKIYKGESYLMESEIYAKQAVSLADALIEQLNKPTPL